MIAGRRRTAVVSDAGADGIDDRHVAGAVRVEEAPAPSRESGLNASG